MIYLLLLLLIFSNQYLLFNEELFIILAFFSLCYFVQSNLGGIVSAELQDRKNKILNSYTSFLTKKSKSLNSDAKNTLSKVEYLCHYNVIQRDYFYKFNEMMKLSKTHSDIELNKNFESNFIIFFASMVSQKRKFL